MSPKKIIAWWRALPAQKRVKWIASLLLILAGTEVVLLAPAIIELAVLIDAFGLLFVLAAAKTSLGTSIAHLWLQAKRLMKPLQIAIRSVEAIADFGTKIPVVWHVRYVAFNTVAAKFAISASLVALCALAIRTAARTFH